MIKTRNDIKDFILDIEAKFPINDWKANDIHLWPIIRNLLFFQLIDLCEQNHAKTIQPIVKKKSVSSFNLIYKILIESFKWLIRLKKMQPKRFLFFSPGHVRVIYNNQMFNRFFDSLILKNKWEYESYIFDYPQGERSKLPKAHKENMLQLIELNHYFKSYRTLQYVLGFSEKDKVSFNLGTYKDFTNHLNSNGLSLIAKNLETQKLKATIHSIMSNTLFFINILNKTQPKTIYLICYYNPLMYALLIAAKQLEIPVLEMQHGPMSNIHMSYTNWTKIPKEGYTLLPDLFNCWEENSTKNMQSWTQNTTHHKAELFGNPWVEFLRDTVLENNFPKKSILYTLQPLVFEELFPQPLLEMIRSSQIYWLIRLHPRQLGQLVNLKNFLKANDVLDLVDIEDATNLPLPLLLQRCSLHITHFSGSTIEAAMMGRFSVLLSAIGVETFKDIIATGDAMYLKLDHTFKNKIERLMEQL